MKDTPAIDAGSYKIHTGSDVLARLSQFLAGKEYSSMFLLADENTSRYCMPELISRVKVLQDAEILEIESGEENKSIEVCVQLWNALSELGADRGSLVVNLGGGVISDMGGFVASAFKRGIDFINIPTTLLAQVDASVGGKTGVDLGNLKNEIGVFSDPQAVFIYPGFLRTLDQRQLRSGFAEIIKHALISGKAYWKKVRSVHPADLEELEQLIPRSIGIKNKIVLSDPREKGRRKALNFGHTVGHAIESYTLGTQAPLLHGEAVAAGIICETYLSHKVKGLPKKQLDEITDYITGIYSPAKLPASKDNNLLELMLHDKKNIEGKMSFSLLEDIGKCVVNCECSEKLVLESLEYYRKHTRT